MIGLGLYFVYSHKFATDAWDLSKVVLPIYGGALVGDITVAWGAAATDTTDKTLEYVLYGVSRPSLPVGMCCGWVRRSC